MVLKKMIQKAKSLFSSLLVLLSIMVLTGCVARHTTTKQAEFPQMYEENPASILILPPINESTDAEAKDYYSTTIPIPLLLHGYYVFPYELTSEILKQEGIYDSELLRDLPLGKFHEYFGADAVMFTMSFPTCCPQATLILLKCVALALMRLVPEFRVQGIRFVRWNHSFPASRGERSPPCFLPNLQLISIFIYPTGSFLKM